MQRGRGREGEGERERGGEGERERERDLINCKKASCTSGSLDHKVLVNGLHCGGGTQTPTSSVLRVDLRRLRSCLFKK